MKYLVVSDSHGLDTALLELQNKYLGLSGYIHCGDSELPDVLLQGFAAVRGNTDYNGLPDSLVIPVGDKKALIIHSHKQGMLWREEALVNLAKLNDCSFVFFGHTHVPTDKMVQDVRLMNPGSFHHNRDGSQPSYGIFEIDDGQAKFTILREEK